MELCELTHISNWRDKDMRVNMILAVESEQSKRLKKNQKKFRLDRKSNLDLCDDRTLYPLRIISTFI